jgi:flagellar biosynthesis activator protein FlaF
MTNAFSARAQNAYTVSRRDITDPDYIEFQVFSQITERMESAKTSADPLQKELHSALFDNAQLWSTVAIDVATPENGLPESLKAQIIYLSEFMRVQRVKVLKGEEKIDGMIEINRMIIAGLAERLRNKHLETAKNDLGVGVGGAVTEEEEEIQTEEAPYITAKNSYIAGAR